MTNYTKYSSKDKPTVAEIEVEETEKETVETKTVEEKKTEVKNDVYGVVTAPLLNFRTAPRLDSNVIDTLGNGTKIKIVKEIPGSDWYKVEYNERFGFVMTSYVEKM